MSFRRKKLFVLDLGKWQVHPLKLSKMQTDRYFIDIIKSHFDLIVIIRDNKL